MDPAVFHQAFEIFRSQGPVFWAATAAIAAGLTILVVSLLVYARGKIRTWRQSRSKLAVTRSSDLGVYARNSGIVSENPMPEAQTQKFPVGTFASGPAGEFLLVRLRETVSRLENLQASLDHQSRPDDESRLKQEPSAVEYKFKKGIG